MDSTGHDKPRTEDHPIPKVRTAHDASDDKRLRRDPADEDAKLDVALDESFPTSDAPSNTQPGKGKDPAPSSGYDAEAERKITRERAGE
ncbi:MAG: hypothetical protein ACREB5_08360 [Sphingomonadaceae bacterium]